MGSGIPKVEGLHISGEVLTYPSPNPTFLFFYLLSLKAKCWVRGGVVGEFPQKHATILLKGTGSGKFEPPFPPPPQHKFKLSGVGLVKCLSISTCLLSACPGFESSPGLNKILWMSSLFLAHRYKGLIRVFSGFSHFPLPSTGSISRLNVYL